MFKKIFINLCNEKKVAPTVVCKAIGLSGTAYSKWDDTSVPRKATLYRLADYFGVTPEYLLGIDDKPPSIQAEDRQQSTQELFDLIDTMDDDQLKQLETYVDFLIEKKKKS